MPEVKREGQRPRYIDVDAVLDARFAKLAASNGRSYKDELHHAMRRHLAQPPKVRLVVEETPLVSDDVKPAPPKKGRRSRKGDTNT